MSNDCATVRAAASSMWMMPVCMCHTCMWVYVCLCARV